MTKNTYINPVSRLPETSHQTQEAIAKVWPQHHQVVNDKRLDHFIQRDGNIYAGNHIIIDLWGASRLDDLEHMEKALKEAVDTCKATLLHIHLHHFSPNGGISGVAVLAESHISVHTWPETDYAAFDVFMCGDSEPEKAVFTFNKYFSPENYNVRNIRRGVVK